MLPFKKMTARRASMLNNVIGFSGSRVVNVLSRFVYLVVVARMLGPELYGLLAYAQSWYLAFWPIALFGLPVFVQHSFGLAADQSERRIALAAAFRWVALGVSMAGCAGLSLLVESDGYLVSVMLVFCLALFGRAGATWFEALLVNHEKGSATLKAALLARPLELLAACLALAFGGGILTLAFIHALSWMLQGAWLGVTASRQLIVPRPDWKWRGIIEIALMSMPIFGVALTSGWLAQGPLILYRHAGGEELGVFALLVQLAVTLAILPQSASQSLLPALTRASIRGDGKDSSFAYQAQKLILLAGGFFAVVTAYLGPLLLTFLFGNAFHAAAAYLAPTVLILTLLSTGLIQQQVLIAQGGYWRAFRIGAFSVLFMLVTWVILSESPGLPEALIVMASGITLRWLLAAAALHQLGAALTYGGLAAGINLAVYALG